MKARFVSINEKQNVMNVHRTEYDSTSFWVVNFPLNYFRLQFDACEGVDPSTMKLDSIY